MTRARHAVSAVVLVSIGVGLLSSCAPGWSRSQVYLSDLLSNPDDVVTSSEQDATEELCAGVNGCVEAWTTDQAYFYRFESNADAEQFLVTVSDGFQSDRITVSFDETQPSAQVKQWVRELVDGAHSFS